MVSGTSSHPDTFTQIDRQTDTHDRHTHDRDKKGDCRWTVGSKKEAASAGVDGRKESAWVHPWRK